MLRIINLHEIRHSMIAVVDICTPPFPPSLPSPNDKLR
jgi:hypothetical protein